MSIMQMVMSSSASLTVPALVEEGLFASPTVSAPAAPPATVPAVVLPVGLPAPVVDVAPPAPAPATAPALAARKGLSERNKCDARVSFGNVESSEANCKYSVRHKTTQHAIEERETDRDRDR
jgi:hypothetical protein